MKTNKERHMNQENELPIKKEQATKQTWEEPKLAFVEPKLAKQGGLKDLTGGNGSFFQTFIP